MINLDYNIGDIVKIEPLSVKGMVEEISISGDGKKYRVEFFLDGDLKSLWLRSIYLTEAKREVVE